MTTPTPEQIEAWARLAEEATDAPWFAGTVQTMDDDSDRQYITIGPHEAHPAVGDHYEDTLATVYSENYREFEANARLIAASRTAVPSLISLCKSQAEELAALRAALVLNEPGRSFPIENILGWCAARLQIVADNYVLRDDATHDLGSPAAQMEMVEMLRKRSDDLLRLARSLHAEMTAPGASE